MKEKKMTTDPLLRTIKVERGYGRSDMHINILLFLIKLLHLAKIKCNYAHAKSVIPKDYTAPLVLRYKGRRYHGEISFWLGEHLVILDFAVLRKDHLKLIEEDGEQLVELEGDNGESNPS